MKHLEQPAPAAVAPTPAKSLAELIADRKVRLWCWLKRACMPVICMFVGFEPCAGALPVPSSLVPCCLAGVGIVAMWQAELQQQLTELEQLPRTTQVKQAISAAKKELRQFRDPSQSWWRW